jgi:hypothetical protein
VPRGKVAFSARSAWSNDKGRSFGTKPRKSALQGILYATAQPIRKGQALQPFSLFWLCR